MTAASTMVSSAASIDSYAVASGYRRATSARNSGFTSTKETRARPVARKQRTCRSPIEPAPTTRTCRSRAAATLPRLQVAASVPRRPAAEADVQVLRERVTDLLKPVLHQHDVAA